MLFDAKEDCWLRRSDGDYNKCFRIIFKYMIFGHLSVGLLCAVLMLSACSGPEVQDPVQPAATVTQQGVRIRYPVSRYPELSLPTGKKRVVRSVLNINKPMVFGEYVWDETGIPAGKSWIRIDLDHQTLSIFRGGHEIGSAVILYGTDGKPTPTGIFPILSKARTHHSTLYDAEMPFMLRLTGDGVAIHASNVRKGAATHGCIGVPFAFAELLYGQMSRGDQVVIV